MQRILSLSMSVLFLGFSAFAQAGGQGRQGGAPAGPVGLAAGQQQSYNRVKGLVMGSVNEMPEEGFSHKPADGIRTFAQIFAHISDFHYGTCAQALGVPNPRMGQPSLEMSVATKADALKTLQESYAFCDPAFMSLTDQTIAEMIMGGRGGPRARGAVLSQLLEHDNEMYGISTVYLRTNNRVPPASQGRGRGGPGGGRQGGGQGAPPPGRGQ